MKTISSLLLGAAVAISLAGCNSAPAHDHDHDHAHAHGHEAEAHPDGAIVLSPEMAQLFGVTTAKAAESEIGAVVKVGGTIEAASDAQGVVTATTS